MPACSPVSLGNPGSLFAIFGRASGQISEIKEMNVFGAPKTCIFSNIWPLARPNIAKKEAAIGEKGAGRVRGGFGPGWESR